MKIALYAREEIVTSSPLIFSQNLFASRWGDLHGVCPSVGGTNVPLARWGVLDSFNTYGIVNFSAMVSL